MFDPGMGAFLNWIHRLSGPRMFGGSVSYFSPSVFAGGPNEGGLLRARITGAYRHSFSSDDKIDPDGSAIAMISFEPMVEIHLARFGGQNQYTIDFAAGASLNWLRGDITDSFLHTSFPAYFQFGLLLSNNVFLKLGLGGHWWPQFDASDFAPLVVDVETTKGEFTPAAVLGFDFLIF